MTNFVVTMTVSIPVIAPDRASAFVIAKDDGFTAPWSASLVSVECVEPTYELMTEEDRLRIGT